MLAWLLVLLLQDVFAVSTARALQGPCDRISEHEVNPSLATDERTASRNYLYSQLLFVDDVIAIFCAHFLTLLMEDGPH